MNNELDLHLSAIELPSDFSRLTHHRSIQVLEKTLLPADVTKRLHELGELHNIPFSKVIRVGYLVLLHRYSGSQKLAGMSGTELIAHLKDGANSDALEGVTTATFTEDVLNPPIQEGTELCLVLEVEGEHAQISFVYDGGLFAESTIRRFAANLLTVLQSITEHPDLPVAQLQLLSAEEQQLLASFNQTATSYPEDQTIVQVFATWVERNPQKTAVCFQGQELTYQELHERSNQLAHALRQRGCTRETVVGLIMDRSLEMVISIMAVLKAGGVYLPIDPKAPPARIEYMLADSQAEMVLTKQHFLTISPGDGTWFYLEREWDWVKTLSTESPESINTSDDLAYIIYTSGSTGKPKGTMLTHRGAVNMGVVQSRAFHIQEQSRILQFASFSFDASVLEVFSALLRGATLVVAPTERLHDPVELTRLLDEEKITFLLTSPSLLQRLPLEMGTGLEVIVSGGEACSAYLAERWAKRVTFINAYGPTETTVIATYWSSSGADHVPNPLPIGRPLPNSKIYILDDHMNQVPIGVGGEMYISDPGVARGYLNRPDLTEERFVNSPFCVGEKLYRTGDLGRYRENGQIEFLGRMDKQVKLRGFRIELGEIEAVLLQHPLVQECVVTLDDTLTDSDRLLAYLVAGQEVSSEEIFAFVSRHLPDYMVPSHVLFISSIPVTINGKVDTRALPRPETMEGRFPYRAPENETQQMLADIWTELLGVQRVGIHDDFFALGGNSLTVFSILLRVKPIYSALGIQDFYKYPTIFQMERHLSQQQTPSVAEMDSVVYVSVTEQDAQMVRLGQSYDPLGAVKVVLLTGATGYLGAYLLAELLAETDAHVYCLVRPSDVGGWQRLEENMRFYFGEHVIELMRGRVTAVEGDLKQPELGLQAEVAERLRAEVDTIVHCGAEVKHYGHHSQFDQVNVQGTAELLKLARGRKGTRFHYVSTLSVAESIATDGSGMDNPYLKSKFLGEELVLSAMQEGVPATIYRVGNLVGHSTTGQFQRNIETNAFYQRLKGMLSYGATYEDPRYVDLTPVDYCGKAIVHLIGLEDALGRTFHVCNPRQITTREFIEGLRRLGAEIRVMASQDYREWLFEQHASGVDQELLQWLLIGQMEAEGQTNVIRFDCADTQQMLVAAGIHCPEPDDRMMERMIRYAVDIGYFSGVLEKVK